VGQSRRPDGAPDTSGLPQATDVFRSARLVRFVRTSGRTARLIMEGLPINVSTSYFRHHFFLCENRLLATAS
jgi:hypothetical protein